MIQTKILSGTMLEHPVGQLQNGFVMRQTLSMREFTQFEKLLDCVIPHKFQFIFLCFFLS